MWKGCLIRCTKNEEGVTPIRARVKVRIRVVSGTYHLHTYAIEELSNHSSMPLAVNYTDKPHSLLNARHENQSHALASPRTATAPYGYGTDANRQPITVSSFLFIRRPSAWVWAPHLCLMRGRRHSALSEAGPRRADCVKPPPHPPTDG